MKSDIFTVIDDIDIYVTSVTGKRIEISRMLFDIEINESIFEHFVSARIGILDTLDLMKNLPLIGNETVEMSIHTTDSNKSVSLEFALYKVAGDTVNTKGDTKRKVLNLYMCSKEAIANGKVSVSKKFSGSAESIVASVLGDYMSSSKDLEYDSASGTITIHSNFWKPSKIIDFACRTAKTALYSDYVFFETFDGFFFKAISALAAAQSVHDLTFKTDDTSFIGNTNIKIFKFDNYFDIATLLRNGAFGTTFFKPHGTEYSFEKVESTLAENLELITTNGVSRMFNDSLSTSGNMVGANFYDPDVSSVRQASLKSLGSYNLSVKMNGDFGRKAGDVVNVDFPNLDNESVIHELFQGNWLILGIKHSIQQNNMYTQNMLLGKNAFFNHKSLSSISAMVNA